MPRCALSSAGRRSTRTGNIAEERNIGEIETLQKCSDGLFWFIMFVHINLYAGHVVSDCGLEELKFSDIYLFIISFLLFSYFSNMQ